MRNPKTGEYVTVCPFLRRVAKERYLSGIHTIKPGMCCTYQSRVWGETFFNRCHALRRADRKCQGPLSLIHRQRSAACCSYALL